MNNVRNRINAAVIAVIVILSLVQLTCGADLIKRMDVPVGPVELRIDKPASNDFLIRWDARQPLDIPCLGPYESRTVIVVDARVPGSQLTIDAEVIDWEKKLPFTTRFVLTVEGKKPDPKPDDPKPDDPKPDNPDVKPAPVQEPGLRVMIIYESQQLSIMPMAQRELLFSANVRAWLTTNCARINNRPEWRFVDQNQPSVVDTPPMKAMFERPRMSVPWLIISNGTKNTGFEGILPASSDEMLRLLEIYK